MASFRVGIVTRQCDVAHRLRKALQAAGRRPNVLVAAETGTFLGPAAGFDLVLADYRLVAEQMFAPLRELRGRLPVVVVSDVPGEEHAVAALRAGADHYVTLARLDRLAAVIDEVLVSRAPGFSQESKTLRAGDEPFRDLAAAILEATTDFVSIASVEGKLRYINRTGRRMLGLDARESLAGRHIRQLHPAPVFERLVEQGIPVALREGHWSGETVLLGCDGREVPVWQVILSHKGEDGEPAYLSTVMRSLVEYRQLEQQLRQSQKMDAMGRLAAGVAHDFNNLLTIISGYTELLLRMANGVSMANDPGVRGDGTSPLIKGVSPRSSVGDIRGTTYLEQILKAGEQAAGLTRQLLAFSRKEVVSPVVLDPEALAQDLHKMLRRLVGEEVQVQTVASPDVGLVRADPGGLEQVILNLVVNARDAILDPKETRTSAPPGSVTIRLEAVERTPPALPARREADKSGHAIDGPGLGLGSGPRPGRFVRLSVQDNGCGMSEDVKARLFEPFFTTKGSGKGTGLGLATVYGIVKQHEGWIEVESQPGDGATFHVYLPRCEGELPAVGASRRFEPRQGSETVLVVEDEPNVRRLAREALRVHGYQVLEAGSGQQALERMAEHAVPIDLLLTDVVMPGMSGRHLADELARRGAVRRVVYMSGYTEDTVFRHGIGPGGGMHFLQKPFTPLVLVRKVREVLDGRTPAAEVQSAECRMQNVLNSALCTLHSAHPRQEGGVV